MRYSLAIILLFVSTVAFASNTPYFTNPPPVAPLAPPLSWSDHLSTPDEPPMELPIADTPFEEHVRRNLTKAETSHIRIPEPAAFAEGLPNEISTTAVQQGKHYWVGTAVGLYSATNASGPYALHRHYGDDQGPAASHITGLATDSHGTLWLATVGGLSARDAKGRWRTWRGQQGLPVEHLTSLAINGDDQLWLGSVKGVIQYRPYAEGRQWYYRQGPRYVPDDQIEAVTMGADGTVLVHTSDGWSAIDTVTRTLQEKAEYFLARYEERHRRMGMPSPAIYPSPGETDTWTNKHQPSDGLWTSYQVTSMSLAYALTGEEHYKALAKEGMEALYLLENITGIPGLVARSMVATNDPDAPYLRTQDNWHATSDGKYLWRDDVSSDQISGHYFAFYTYFEHIAKNDPAERARLEKQLRQVTDYILDNDYQIPDWDGERTLWGWWNPAMVNDSEHYLECGLYSLMMLSFLKTANYITGDEKYIAPFKELIKEHGYLSNILTQKWVAPDEINHSDDQLSAVVFYPFLQMESDPYIRDVLHRALRKHARIELPERNSLLEIVYATVDPDADIDGCLQTLREMPLDRRDWPQNNLDRADVVVDRAKNVRGNTLLLDVLPADEREFERWNADPYVADTGGDGTMEGAGIQWLLPYWIARFHGILE